MRSEEEEEEDEEEEGWYRKVRCTIQIHPLYAVPDTHMSIMFKSRSRSRSRRHGLDQRKSERSSYITTYLSAPTQPPHLSHSHE